MIIVEVGSLNMDLVIRLPNLPRPGETLMGGVFRTYPGGKGANQAVAAARLGAQVHMVGCVGNDLFAKELIKNLESEGIDTSHVIVHPEESTGVAVIQVDEQGRNSIGLAGGANLRLTPENVTHALHSIGEFDALVMPLEVPIDVVVTAARIASEKGALVILNPAPAQLIPQELLQLIDVLVPNETEIEGLTDMEVRSDEDLHRAADKLHDHGLMQLVVTLGSRGCIFSTANTNEKIHIPARLVKAVDTTAAGDCFVGALTVGLCEGMAMIAAIEFANDAAAISVTRFGAQPSLPYRDEVERSILNRRPE